jgi:hypothetical protein
MKYEYFKLVYNVLIMVQCRDQDGHEWVSESPFREIKENIREEEGGKTMNSKLSP